MVGQRVNRWLVKEQLKSFIRQNDVVFFEWAGSLLIQATSLPKIGKIVTRLHSIELATSADKVLWEKVDATIVLNRHINKRLLSISSKLSSSNVFVIPNGVNLSLFKPFERRFQYRIGMVCRVVPLKRVYEIVLAVFELRHAGYPFKLHIAGAPAPKKEQRYIWAIENLMEKLNLRDCVKFYGPIENIPDWLKGIDIFISNSYWEGQQMGLLEAMSSECYCLSHCWSGVEEILPPENIFVTNSDLQDRLVTFAQLSDVERKEKQHQLRKIVEIDFDETKMVKAIISVIEQVVS
jgi:glycosyltransferase involved in cell wall biosynthesis